MFHNVLKGCGNECSTSQITLVGLLEWAGRIIDIDLFHGWQFIGLQVRMGGAHKSAWPAAIFMLYLCKNSQQKTRLSFETAINNTYWIRPHPSSMIHKLCINSSKTSKNSSYQILINWDNL